MSTLIVAVIVTVAAGPVAFRFGVARSIATISILAMRRWDRKGVG
jgi:hypothetical protein